MPAMTPSLSEGRGFTLVELMVTVAVAAILMAVALPSFNTWTQNTKIRSTAEAMQNTMRLAKTEAVRRSSLVDFVLTSGPPAKDAPVSTTGNNWYVEQHPPTPTPAGFDPFYVEGSDLAGVNKDVTVTGDVGSLTFNSLGRLINGSGGVPPLPYHSFDVNNLRGDRPLRVIVAQSGDIRMCDPKIGVGPMSCPSP